MHIYLCMTIFLFFINQKQLTFLLMNLLLYINNYLLRFTIIMNETDDIIKVCMNEEELVETLYSDEDMIYVEASFGKKIANIKNTGKIAWGILIGGIIVAVTAIVSSKKLSKGKTVLISSIAAIPSASVAILYIGLPATLSLIQIMTHAYKKYGGINAAKDIVLKLRNDYYIAEKDREKFILKKVAGEEVKEVKITEIKKQN